MEIVRITLELLKSCSEIVLNHFEFVGEFLWRLLQGSTNYSWRYLPLARESNKSELQLIAIRIEFVYLPFVTLIKLIHIVNINSQCTKLVFHVDGVDVASFR